MERQIAKVVNLALVGVVSNKYHTGVRWKIMTTASLVVGDNSNNGTSMSYLLNPKSNIRNPKSFVFLNSF